LHIVVCVKHVPDATDIRFDPITLNLIREGVPSIVNPFCLNAVEEAIQMKERLGATITAVSMGPLQAQEGLREALAMGVDRAIMVSDREMAGADTLATSYTLWKTIQKVAETSPFDLILSGKVAIDGETGQVPPGLAVRFNIPIISNVAKIEEIDLESRTIFAKHRFDDGIETVRARLPAVLTITEEANKPRKFTIEGMLRAKRAEIEVWDKNAIQADPSLLGLKGSPTIVKKVFPPPGRKQGEIFDGTSDPRVAARWLVQKLVEVRAFSLSSEVMVKKTTLGESVDAILKSGNGEASGKFGEVWVFIEHLHGKPAQVGWELLGEGRRLAKIYGTKLAALIIGNNVSHLSKEAFARGADKVYLVEDQRLEDYRTQPYAVAMEEAARKFKPEALLIGATIRGRDLAGSAATFLGTGLIADCTAVDVEIETGTFMGTRPDYGGNLMSTIICPKHRPTMASVRPRVMKSLPPSFGREGEVVRVNVNLEPNDLNTEVKEFVPIEKFGVRLEDAQIIVSGGRGLGSAKNFQIVEELANVLHAQVGASRAAVRSGWIGAEHQVGQTGFTVRPRLYVAVGISGAIQHIVGIMNVDYIVAINRDPNTPIFKMADFGVVGDLFKVVPALTDELRNVSTAELAPWQKSSTR
jgi:electron transfer flavoprotein alpha subunit